MAKNDLGFDQKEFQSMDTDAFERADQAIEPGERLGALEVSGPMRTGRSFRNQAALDEASQSQRYEEALANEAAYAEATAEQETGNLNAVLLEEQMLLNEEAQELQELNAEAAEQMRREQNTAKLFLWGSITIFLFPPAGVAVLKYPILVQKFEAGSSAIPGASILKLLNKYAPYPPGKRMMAEFLIWSVPAVWGVLAAVAAGLLIAYLVILGMCTSDNFIANAVLGSTCSYYFGIDTSILSP